MVTRLRRRGTVAASGATTEQPRPEDAAEGTKTPQAPPWRARVAGLPGLLRRHWLISALLAAGLVLRVLVQIAYSPPIIYVDTLKYLYRLYPGSEPLGYRFLLKIILFAGDLNTVAFLQHLLGLAMAVALYLVLLRRGSPRWLAALATAPVLLDAYQLQMEQTIMPDVWFEAMMVAGLAVLLWMPAPPLRFFVISGLILGAAATVKQQGDVLILPALCYVLAAAGGWRRPFRSGVALVVAFVLPIAAYCSWSYAQNGHFRLAARQSLTGRLMGAVDCATLNVPPAARKLCPTPAEQAMGPDNLEHSGKSPLYQGTLPPGMRGTLIGDLNHAVETQQPGRVVVAIAHDWLRIFTASRTPATWSTPVTRWQFQTQYPTAPPWVQVGSGGVVIIGLQKLFRPFHFVRLPAAYGGPARVDRPLAVFLRGYQFDGGYTPGWLLAVLALAALAGSGLALRRRNRADPAVGEPALACLAFTVTAVVVLLIPIAVEFSWRYELPAVVTLPPAGILGITAILAARRSRRPSAATDPAPEAAATAALPDPPLTTGNGTASGA